jgi:glycosyltransferase involved in cell wall biosynthesis
VSHDWPRRTLPAVSSEELPPNPPLSRVKVLHVITKFSTGAGGNTLLSATGMDPSRYEVWIAACTRGPVWERPLWERAERAGVKTFRLPRLREKVSPINDLIVLYQLVRLIRRERFALVHTHTAKGGLLGRIAAGVCRTPVVIHTFHSFPFHDFMSSRRRRAYLFMERLVRPMTDYFLAVSPRVAREAVEHRLASPGMISVIPSAVELDKSPSRPDRSLRREFGIPDSAPLIGTVGRVDFQKAPIDFVHMAATVADNRPAAHFMIVGDGPLVDDVRREAERLGIDIVLPGFRHDAARIAATFDVFVISSLYEGLGRALTEALSSARPVVATAVNGVPDLVVPGATGLLAPPHSPDRLADCVIWLLDHPNEARRMGLQGRSAVVDLFDPDVMCSLLNETYERLLGQPTETPDAVVDVRDSDDEIVSTDGLQPGVVRLELTGEAGQ